MDHDFVDIPFASSIVFELHYDDQCVIDKKSSQCFNVMVYHNNVPLKFSKCLENNKKRGSQSDFCLYDDFMEYYNSIKFQGDIDKACMQPFVPPSESITNIQ